MSKLDVETEGQDVLFPELDKSPLHKKILKSARALFKVRENRKELLGPLKEEEDKLQEQLVGDMHEAKIERFTHAGLKVEIKPKSERVKIKPDGEEDGEDAEDD